MSGVALQLDNISVASGLVLIQSNPAWSLLVSFLRSYPMVDFLFATRAHSLLSALTLNCRPSVRAMD